MATTGKRREGQKQRAGSEYMRLEEAAEYFRVHKDTVRRWISEGRLTGYTIGPNTRRVLRDEVVALPRRIPTAGSAA